MLATMHNANEINQLSGDYAMESLNDRVHGLTDPDTHRLFGDEGSSFLPATGEPGLETAATGRKRRVDQPADYDPWGCRPATSSLPAAAWAALVIARARQTAGRERTVVRGSDAGIC